MHTQKCDGCKAVLNLKHAILFVGRRATLTHLISYSNNAFRMYYQSCQMSFKCMAMSGNAVD